MKIWNGKMGLKSKSLPVFHSPPFLACRIKTGADSVFQAFHVAPAQWFCHPTANRSTEGWHGKKTKQAAGPIHLLPYSLPSPCCSLWCCLINLPFAPFGFSRPLCGVLPLSSTNKMLITALKAKVGFKEKFWKKGESNGGHFQYKCSIRNKWPEWLQTTSY